MTSLVPRHRQELLHSFDPALHGMRSYTFTAVVPTEQLPIPFTFSIYRKRKDYATPKIVAYEEPRMLIHSPTERILVDFDKIEQILPDSSYFCADFNTPFAAYPTAESMAWSRPRVLLGRLPTLYSGQVFVFDIENQKYYYLTCSGGGLPLFTNPVTRSQETVPFSLVGREVLAIYDFGHKVPLFDILFLEN
jgi:hypothetical protein